MYDMYYVYVGMKIQNDIINLNIHSFYLLFNISSILMKLPHKWQKKIFLCFQIDMLKAIPKDNSIEVFFIFFHLFKKYTNFNIFPCAPACHLALLYISIQIMCLCLWHTSYSLEN